MYVVIYTNGARIANEDKIKKIKKN
jgi:hypothetical protein